MRFSQLFALSFLLVGMLLTSCGTFSEEVWINADGSGRYKLKYDAAESLAMIEMMSQMGGNEEAGEAKGSEDPEEAMKKALAQEKFDTTFNLMSAMPDSVKQIMSSRAAMRKGFEDQGEVVTEAKLDTVEAALNAMKNLDFGMKMDKEAGVLDFGMTINFDNPSAVANTFESINTLQAMGPEDSQAGGMADKMGNRTTFEMVGKKKVIVRQAPVDNMDELLNAAGDEVEGMDAEQMEGMLEMMGLSNYEVRVHVPGIVQSVVGADYVQENDNTVVLNINYLEAMKGGELMQAEINFKPKKKMRMTVPK